jgi:hypothetical protein
MPICLQNESRGSKRSDLEAYAQIVPVCFVSDTENQDPMKEQQLVVSCPQCQQRLRVGSSHLGSQLRCPRCRAEFKNADAHEDQGGVQNFIRGCLRFVGVVVGAVVAGIVISVICCIYLAYHPAPPAPPLTAEENAKSVFDYQKWEQDEQLRAQAKADERHAKELAEALRTGNFKLVEPGANGSSLISWALDQVEMNRRRQQAERNWDIWRVREAQKEAIRRLPSVEATIRDANGDFLGTVEGRYVVP